jgi:PhoH-like ATPase
MSKIFILDTNVLLFDPQAVNKFGKNQVIIPITVIEEIDRFKKDLNENGRNARQFSRMMDELRAVGSLSKGVPIPSGGTLKVVLAQDTSSFPNELVDEKADNRILAVAYAEARAHGAEKVHFITKDTNLRIKADALGIASEDYETSQVTIEELYSGVCVFEVTPDAITTFSENNQFDLIVPNPNLTYLGNRFSNMVH